MESHDEKFKAIYEKYRPLLIRLVLWRRIPNDDVEDLVQDVFLSFYTHYVGVEDEREIRRLLMASVFNRCVDYWRKHQAHPISCADPLDLYLSEVTNRMLTQRGTLTTVIQREMCREVMNVIYSMKPESAIIIIMLVIQERPVQEVCEMLDISEAACRMRLMRARKQLRKQFLEDQHEKEQEQMAKREKKSESSGPKAVPGKPDNSEIPGNA